MRDFRQARERRRFYLERGMKRTPRGAGSDLTFLMTLPLAEVELRPEDFGDVPALVVGGVAARAYAPERHTKDINFLIEHERFPDAKARLRGLGYCFLRSLAFPNTGLGLYGEAYSKEQVEVDIISSPQEWCRQAFQGRVEDRTGLRVIPLSYFVLMKLDSARGVDQGDLTRVLGRLNENEIEQLVAVTGKYSADPEIAEDVRQYAALGRWELESEPQDQQGRPGDK